MSERVLSDDFLELAEELKNIFGKPENIDISVPKIEVDEAIRSIAGFYEKTRNVLEYGEGDFLRQRAIERALKRILNFKIAKDPEALASDLLRDLIRSGYFPNAVIPEYEASRVALVLGRLFEGLNCVSSLFRDELITFAAFCIEDAIFPERMKAQNATVAFVVKVCEERLRWPKSARESSLHRVFLFIAAHKTVLQASDSRALFSLLRDALPQWFSADPYEIQFLKNEFEKDIALAKKALASSVSERYISVVRKFAPALRSLDNVLGSYAREDPSSVEGLEGFGLSPLVLERRLGDDVDNLMALTRVKLKTIALRSTLYVFFTKMLVGLSLEMPYDYFVAGVWLTKPFIINLIFPPVLMFLVAFSARPPRQTVAEKIVDTALKIATTQDGLGYARLSSSRSSLRLFLFVLTTLALSGGALFVILKALAFLKFSVVSMIVFLVFLSVISLFAWRVRRPLRELSATGRGGGVFGALTEIIVFPFLALGRMLSSGIQNVNVFLFIADVFIEAPLKFLFAAGEDWLAFLREKREELIEEE